MKDADTAEAAALMMDFARRTGLVGDLPPRRYLWTDAFAVCNFLGLARATGEERYRRLALSLVGQVHQVLGRHRDDDPRQGWVSGLGEREGGEHPTRGGLRIGKGLPEREPGATFRERQEWDRDGQYFHYLTRWMHALDQVSRDTGDARYNVWARELDATAYSAFSYIPDADQLPRMYWKMSIDLSRPLVLSMGQHDALDGYITTLQLRATRSASFPASSGPDLAGEAAAYRDMALAGQWASPDPLGIGGLLDDAYRVAQLMALGAVKDGALLERLLQAALNGLESYARSGELEEPADYRLAFRELGLAIGLAAVQELAEGEFDFETRVADRLESLRAFVPLGEEIEAFWRKPGNRQSAAWSGHRDISEVMLATRLIPEGFLALR